MSNIGLILNLLLAVLLVATLAMGWRLNRRLTALRDSHDGFALAVRELDGAAARAEQGLADLRAATDEAIDVLGDRIEKGRGLALKLERLIDRAPAATRALELPARSRPEAADDGVAERRLGALLAAAREARPQRLEATPIPAARRRPVLDDELFEDLPLTLDDVHGASR